uniref:Ig-like domain-containing protein n=1 Tax=Astyanax mexicanus TaxID=7994 RepID=A0A8B9HSP8_ASTMX
GGGLVVGQNVSLPCIVAEKHEVNINQIEWDVKIKDNRERLVVFSPQYRPHYFEPVYLELVNRTNSTILRGSILHLYNVTKKDSGTYFCYITTFPYGSYQNSTVVQVTGKNTTVTVTLFLCISLSLTVYSTIKVTSYQ